MTSEASIGGTLKVESASRDERAESTTTMKAEPPQVGSGRATIVEHDTAGINMIRKVKRSAVGAGVTHVKSAMKTGPEGPIASLQMVPKTTLRIVNAKSAGTPGIATAKIPTCNAVGHLAMVTVTAIAGVETDQDHRTDRANIETQTRRLPNEENGQRAVPHRPKCAKRSLLYHHRMTRFVAKASRTLRQMRRQSRNKNRISNRRGF